jgi:hypothetical protein
MKINLYFIYLSVICCCLFCCKKDNKNNAGTIIVSGGKTILTAQVKHHQNGVGKCNVFIKYNVTEFPGKDISVYDSLKVTDPNGYVVFNGLPNGNYYFYACGYDISVADTVWGYSPLTVSAKPGEEKEIDTIIPVSE